MSGASIGDFLSFQLPTAETVLSGTDHYRVLGLPVSASGEEIKRRYRQLAKEYHTDHGGRTDVMQVISAAYTVLRDAETRRIYDIKLADNDEYRNENAIPMPSTKCHKDDFRCMFNQWKEEYKQLRTFTKTPNQLYSKFAKKHLPKIVKFSGSRSVKNESTDDKTISAIISDLFKHLDVSNNSFLFDIDDQILAEYIKNFLINNDADYNANMPTNEFVNRCVQSFADDTAIMVAVAKKYLVKFCNQDDMIYDFIDELYCADQLIPIIILVQSIVIEPCCLNQSEMEKFLIITWGQALFTLAYDLFEIDLLTATYEEIHSVWSLFQVHNDYFEDLRDEYESILEQTAEFAETMNKQLNCIIESGSINEFIQFFQNNSNSYSFEKSLNLFLQANGDDISPGQTNFEKTVSQGLKMVAAGICEILINERSKKGLLEISNGFWVVSSFLSPSQSDDFTNFFLEIISSLHKNNYSFPYDVTTETYEDFLTSNLLPEYEELTPRLHCFWPQLQVPGVDTVMFEKYEKAIFEQVAKRKGSIEAALSYYELIFAAQHSSQVLICISICAQWYLLASQESMEPSVVHACRCAIFHLGMIASQCCHQFTTHPFMQFYVARIFLALEQCCIFATNETLSEHEKAIFKSQLQMLFRSTTLCPLFHTPVINASEAVIMHILSQKVHCHYMMHLQRMDNKLMLPISVAKLNYHIFENDLCKRAEIQDSESQRHLTMQLLLEENNWSWSDVKQLMTSSMIQYDEEGWLNPDAQLFNNIHHSMSFQTFYGLSINKKTMEINFLTDRNISHAPISCPLLSVEDLIEGISMEGWSFFSLDKIEQFEKSLHPFQLYNFQPKLIKGTQFLHTLFQTDYLLKQFSVGYECHR